MSGTSSPLQVMVVDDSAIVRGLVTRMLEADPEIKVTASVGNGQLAIDSLKRTPVDVIVLDIEMPVMDGLTAVPKLLDVDPDIQIVMSSTLTTRNADISMRALQAGAADYIPKPTSSRELTGGQDFKREIVEKVKALGLVRRQKAPSGARPFRAQAAAPQPRPTAQRAVKPRGSGKVTLREPGILKPSILAIGSSTGGPQALFSLLGGLKSEVKVPIVVTQHMPATFTAILAEHITRVSGWPCGEAQDGEVITPGRVILAPGDFHMLVEVKGGNRVIRLAQTPPENFCRPAVDPMLRSLSEAYGGRVLAVILTGMGSDGTKGAEHLVSQGGTVVAQDEASSVVWGMPGSVAEAGLCAAVLPLADLPTKIKNLLARGM